MTRSLPRLLLLGSLLGVAAGAEAARAAERTNVVLILMDDLGGRDLGCYGSTYHRSPRSYFAPFQGKDGRFMPGLEKAPEGEYLTDRLTAEAEKFIEHNRDRPFFLHLAHYAVHIPLRGKPDLVAKYKAGGPAGTQNN